MLAYRDGMSVVDNAGARSADRIQRVAHGSHHPPGETWRLGAPFDVGLLDPHTMLDRLGEIETRERTLIAEAIHDDPLQLIVAAMTHVDLLSATHPGSEQKYDVLNSMLESAVEKLRALIVATSPPNFDEGLGAALGRLAAGIFIGTSTSVDVRGPADVPLTTDARLAAYRIVREALINIRKHAAAQRASIDVMATDDAVVISVTDDGVGCGRPRSGGGHLGLSAMRSRARAVAGAVRITSIPGAGTIVALTLPPVDPHPIRSPVLRVFLVDDDAAGRQDLADMMDHETNLTVVGQASSIADALEQIPLHRPDVLVVDVALRDGNGADLCARIRRILPHIQCMILTSSADADSVTAAIRAGAMGYLMKDTDPGDVLAALWTVAAGRSVFDGRVATMLVDRLRD